MLLWMTSYFLAMALHECGHWIAARLSGVRVVRVFLGLDAGDFALLRWRNGHTTYGLGWLPLGSYVLLFGMHGAPVPNAPRHDYRSKPHWVRALIAVAGPGVNALVATALGFWWNTPTTLPSIALNMWLAVWCMIPLANSDGDHFVKALKGALFSPYPLEATSHHEHGGDHTE